METTQTIEPKFRVNMKMSARGELYGECTARGDSIKEIEADLDKLLAIIKKRSTVNKE